ncbi:hypothetical protein [Halalkalibacillus halophilus]|uniref:hypothetical protein n=1 Tax=Halalkalibacillus halophilus TaxID=392827 RepID=UPI0004145D92|nr:hypothetical protein [Halalkalibacillus halophilus]
MAFEKYKKLNHKQKIIRGLWMDAVVFPLLIVAYITEVIPRTLTIIFTIVLITGSTFKYTYNYRRWKHGKSADPEHNKLWWF